MNVEVVTLLSHAFDVLVVYRMDYRYLVYVLNRSNCTFLGAPSSRRPYEPCLNDLWARARKTCALGLDGLSEVNHNMAPTDKGLE